MGVVVDIRDREVGRHKRIHQRKEGKQQQGELDECRGGRDCHPLPVTARRADQWQQALDQCDP